MASNVSVKGIFMRQATSQPKIVHLAKGLYNWFTAMPSEGKHITGACDN